MPKSAQRFCSFLHTTNPRETRSGVGSPVSSVPRTAANPKLAKSYGNGPGRGIFPHSMKSVIVLPAGVESRENTPSLRLFAEAANAFSHKAGVRLFCGFPAPRHDVRGVLSGTLPNRTTATVPAALSRGMVLCLDEHSSKAGRIIPLVGSKAADGTTRSGPGFRAAPERAGARIMLDSAPYRGLFRGANPIRTTQGVFSGASR